MTMWVLFDDVILATEEEVGIKESWRHLFFSKASHLHHRQWRHQRRPEPEVVLAGDVTSYCHVG